MARKATTTERGYDAAYRAERAAWSPKVLAGNVDCWRCGKPIVANTDREWHLGHDDEDRSIIRGPEHPMCNLRSAGRRGNRIARERAQMVRRSWFD